MSTELAERRSDTPPILRALPATRATRSMEQDVIEGLLQAPRRLPAKYFYDETGSLLFDRICDHRQYYLTRAEDGLLGRAAHQLLREVAPARITELGSGTSRKTRRLLEACEALGQRPVYTPIDVSGETVLEAAEGLCRRFPWLRVEGLVGDFHAGLDGLPRTESPNLFLFLGSTLGNLDYAAAAGFLAELRAIMAPEDRLLMGLDRFKSPAVLHEAYNDDDGLTAEFNLNVLRVLNERLDADFQLDAFAHYAAFNPWESRMEMYLVATRAQQVRFGALERETHLSAGEPILTEISCKYTDARIERLLAQAGLRRHGGALDAEGGGYSLLLLAPA